MYRWDRRWVILFISLFILYSVGGQRIAAQAQFNQKIEVSCQNGRVRMEFSSWLPDETITTFVDEEKVGSFITDSNGSGVFSFPAGAQNLMATRGNGDTFLAGFADCAKPRPGTIASASLDQIMLPREATTRIEVVGENEAGNPIDVIPLWVAEYGAISANGDYSATTEGDFLVSANLLGSGYSFTYQIAAFVSPPLTDLVIFPEEVYAFIGQGKILEVIATDINGNRVEVFPEWENQGAGDILPDGFFTPGDKPGVYVLTATIPGTGFSAKVLVHITPPVERIKISPEIEELTVGDVQQFEVIGLGPNDIFVDVPLTPVWSAEIGVIGSDGRYAAMEPGNETLMAVVDLNQLAGNPKGGSILAMQGKLLSASQKLTIYDPPSVNQSETMTDTMRVDQNSDDAAAKSSQTKAISQEIEEVEMDEEGKVDDEVIITSKDSYYSYYDKFCLTALLPILGLGFAIHKTGRYTSIILAVLLMGAMLVAGFIMFGRMLF